MARGKAISVKIPTQRVITALETKLAELETNWANQEANEAKYEKARESMAQGSASIRYCSHSRRNQLPH